MIIYSGWGLAFVLVDYILALYLISGYAKGSNFTIEQSYLFLTVFHVVMTAGNYFFARFLNRKGVRHTVYGIKLENFVLLAGSVMFALILLMVSGEIFS